MPDKGLQMSPHLSGYKAVCLRSMDSIVRRKAPNTLPTLLLAISLVALAGKRSIAYMVGGLYILYSHT